MLPHYINPLICAFLYAIASLSMKRALAEGAGATRSVFVTNACFFFGLLPLWWFFPSPVDPALLWAPALAGLVAFGGGLFQFMALKLGDVSVATPLLGGKVLFVALFSTVILGNVLPLSWWGGAVLAGLGVFFLGQVPGGHRHGSKLGLTILLSLLSVASFALMDIVIAGWGETFGFQRFVVVQQVVTFGLSFALIPLFRAPLASMSRSCWPWLLLASVIIVGQYYLLNWTIAIYKDPTAINIFYSSRGIWSVILVWGIGPVFGNRERGLGWPVFWRRVLGACLLFMAICLVLFEKSAAI